MNYEFYRQTFLQPAWKEPQPFTWEMVGWKREQWSSLLHSLSSRGLSDRRNTFRLPDKAGSNKSIPLLLLYFSCGGILATVLQ